MASIFFSCSPISMILYKADWSEGKKDPPPFQSKWQIMENNSVFTLLFCLFDWEMLWANYGFRQHFWSLVSSSTNRHEMSANISHTNKFFWLDMLGIKQQGSLNLITINYIYYNIFSYVWLFNTINGSSMASAGCLGVLKKNNNNKLISIGSIQISRLSSFCTSNKWLTRHLEEYLLIEIMRGTKTSTGD